MLSNMACLLISDIISFAIYFPAKIITFFFLFSVCYDYLRISNDKNQSFGLYCGRKSPRNVVVTGNSVVVQFHSDPAVQGKGFKLIFKAVQCEYNSSHNIVKYHDIVKYLTTFEAKLIENEKEKG